MVQASIKCPKIISIFIFTFTLKMKMLSFLFRRPSTLSHRLLPCLQPLFPSPVAALTHPFSGKPIVLPCLQPPPSSLFSPKPIFRRAPFAAASFSSKGPGEDEDEKEPTGKKKVSSRLFKHICTHCVLAADPSKKVCDFKQGKHPKTYITNLAKSFRFRAARGLKHHTRIKHPDVWNNINAEPCSICGNILNKVNVRCHICLKGQQLVLRCLDENKAPDCHLKAAQNFPKPLPKKK